MREHPNKHTTKRPNKKEEKKSILEDTVLFQPYPEPGKHGWKGWVIS